jgi:hypothetical protein
MADSPHQQQDAAHLAEAFHPAFDAMAEALRTAARRLASTDWAPFANALREIEAAEAKNRQG